MSNLLALTSFLVALAVEALCIHWNSFGRCEERVLNFFYNFFLFEFQHLWTLFEELLSLMLVDQIETYTFFRAV